MLKALKSSALLGTFFVSHLAFTDVINPELLLNKKYTALPTFEAVATVDYLSNKPKGKEDLAAEDFNSLNQDPLFQAISRLEFSWNLTKASQKCVDDSKILDKVEAALLKRNLLDLVQNAGLQVININVLNNSSGTTDDSALKPSVFLGTTKDFKKEKDLALSVNLVLKKDGSCHSPNDKQITAALLALFTK